MRHSSLRSYGLALLTTASAFALTRFTWPLFAGTPFVPFFGAVAITTQWGSARAGLVAVVLALVGADLAYPAGGPSVHDPKTLVIFVVLALLANRVMAGRNRSAAALRASEAELRAALQHVQESEQALRRAQKMEAIGQLVAGVAHNFNNLLIVTMGYADNLLDRHPPGDEDHPDLCQIRQAAERGAAMTRQLLAFGPNQMGRAALVDVDALVAGLQSTLGPAMPAGIQLTAESSPTPALVVIDPNDMEQVIVNLVFNARDALADGGEIHIDVARVQVDAANRPLDVSASPGEYVRLRVTDNGTGMSPEVQAHLFEPFFTTKDVGQGTGLGLAFVHGIVRAAGGFVSIESAPARGTVASVFLPPAAGAALAGPDRDARLAFTG